MQRRQLDPKSVFPLSRYFHYDNFKHYYAFGNSLAEDFLQSVATDDCSKPIILSLGCGDMRSFMFTIFNNFGLEDRRFKGVHFVVNDRSPAILARNILFLYLCINMPGTEVDIKQWIASIWSLWYNHELLPQHKEMFCSSLDQLVKWSSTWEEWSQCPLGEIVCFSSPATFFTIKKVWGDWLTHPKKSVDEMKSGRNHFQCHHMKTYCKTRDEYLKVLLDEDLTFKSIGFLYPSKTMDIMNTEYLQYLAEGTVWAELVLGISTMENPMTIVNSTLFEREDGMYTLQYALTPYMVFTQSFQYTHAELSRSNVKDNALFQFLPVADVHFQSMPLLANSVQQFAMWLHSTAHCLNSHDIKISFMFDVGDSINLCYNLLNHPKDYSESALRFDAIYTSNLLDHLSPPALVFNALPLLKSAGTLFTSTFKTLAATNREYLEKKFGFSPELFPAHLGVHCIGHDGVYSPAVNHEPHPNLLKSLSHCTVFSWRKITSQSLISDSIEDSPHAMMALLKLCRVSCADLTLNIGSVESFICVLRQFLKQFQNPVPSYHFFNPLCSAIQNEPDLKLHLVQLQIQSLLHGVHMHITLTEDNCPICSNQPLNSFIQQVTLDLDITKCNIDTYEAPTFVIFASANPALTAMITSFSVNRYKSILKLTFFLPNQYYFKNNLLCVKIVEDKRMEDVYFGTMESLKPCSSITYEFMKEFKQPCTTRVPDDLGCIISHLGDSSSFKSEIAMNKTCQVAIKSSKLNVKTPESDKLMLHCGKLTSTIVYPYAIDSSTAHIKISKKRQTISVTVKRHNTIVYKGRSTHFLDPSNHLILPQYKCSTEVMNIYCDLQALYNGPEHPLFNAKRSFTELFKNSLSGVRMFTLSFPSKRFVGAPDVYALVYVHNLLFSTVFASPALDMSYCFLDATPKHLLPAFRTLQNHLGARLDIMVDDAEYKLLKDIFKYFTNSTQSVISIYKDKATLTAQEFGLWKYFDHALLFPLYPNLANPTYQKFLKFAEHSVHIPGGLRQTTNMTPSPEQQLLSMIGQGRMNACSFCQAPGALKSCGRCRKATYCSKECQRMHWIIHKLVCSAPEQKDSPVTVPNESSSLPLKPMGSTFHKPQAVVSDSSSKRFPSESTTKIEVHIDSDDELLLEEVKDSHSCTRCKKPANIICACESVYYCSQACKTLEWPQHSEICQRPYNSKKNVVSTSSESRGTQNINTTTSGTSSKAAELVCQDGDSVRAVCTRCKKQSTITCQCQSVSYCSRECQVLEWPEHKEKCKHSKSELYASSKSQRHGMTSQSITSMSLTSKCSSCGRVKQSLKHCKCRIVLYCSVECQRLHWPQHKSKCTFVRSNCI